jgi:poly(3-hydroxybutyrate) depolymerase
MIKRILLTATAIFAAVGFVGSTLAIAAPMADEAAPASSPAKKSTKKKSTAKKSSTKKKKAPPATTPAS